MLLALLFYDCSDIDRDTVGLFGDIAAVKYRKGFFLRDMDTKVSCINSESTDNKYSN